MKAARRTVTVVLAASVDGLALAHRHGFVESGRREVDGVAFPDSLLPRARRRQQLRGLAATWSCGSIARSIADSAVGALRSPAED